MQIEQAEELRRAWGDKPCDHPDYEKEYCMGADTGDYICTTCGHTFVTKDEARAAAAKAKRNRNVTPPS